MLVTICIVIIIDLMCACHFSRNIKIVTKNNEKCYDGLGCVALTPEWTDPMYRPVNVLPSDRHVVNTIFVHWIMYENLTSEIIGTSIKDCKNIHSSGVTVMLIHDYTSNGYTGWIQHLSRAILSLPEPVKSRSGVKNIISVDWAAGAEPPYIQAVANARLVALEVVNFLDSLRKIFNLDPSSVHIVGHGLGAHIAGYVGKMLHLHKITALDPSGPYFEFMPPPVRLHKDDAKFVEVVHTDAQSYGQGSSEMMGHIDYYPNGGREQPGCVDGNVLVTNVQRGDMKLGETLSACSHKRSVKYYIEALINPLCRYTAISCSSYTEFLKGNCATCGNNSEFCSSLNFLSQPRNLINTNGFFLVTSNASPFCGEMLKVTLVLRNQDNGMVKGYFNVTVPQGHGDINFLINENQPPALVVARLWDGASADACSLPHQASTVSEIELASDGSALSTLHGNAYHSFVVFRSTPPILLLPARVVHVKWQHGFIPCSWCTPPKIHSLMITKVSDKTSELSDQWFCPITSSVDETVGISLEPCRENNIKEETTLRTTLRHNVDYY